jgi:hypothetical protein
MDDPYYRFLLFKSPVSMISWNAVLACDAQERLSTTSEGTETLREIHGHHAARMLGDGITHSVLDAMPDRVPYFCYLGFALGDYGVMPLAGRFGLKWYPVHDVRIHWEVSPAVSALELEKARAQIERKCGVKLTSPPRVLLP